MPTLLSTISYFSLMRGVLSPYEICKHAKELGYTKIALTDRNNLYGLPEFLKSCYRAGLQPITAAEVTDENHAALIYTHGKAGYSNLCRVITEKHCNGNFSIINSLQNANEGLCIVTDDILLIGQLYKSVPVYFRIKSLQVPPRYIKEKRIPCLVIPEGIFSSPQEYKIHKLLRAVDRNTSLTNLPADELYPADAVLSSWGRVCERFAVFGDALGATEEFAESIHSYTDFGKAVMPELLFNEPASQVLRKKSFEGAAKRYFPVTQAVTERLNYELDLICRKGFASYFLVVEDIVKQSPRTCGRGSGAASCVAYCLGITNVDPIRYNLMFERFLNPGRVDPPDIDVDFAWDERDSVLDYVFEKYGKKHTAMVANHLTFQPRMAMREVARVYGLTESEISTVTKRFPYFYEMGSKGINIRDILKNHPRTRHVPLDQPWPEIIETAQKLVGIPRGIGTHCGGVVITPEPIWNYVPVQYSAKGYPIIQWEKDGTEDMGLVKIDLLGNRSLAVIRDAIGNVKNNGGASFDEKKWDPAKDQRTIDLLAHGRSMGVFYVESPAMRLLQEKTGKGDFEHLTIHSSIIRPAANKYITEYIRRLRGGAYKSEHPLLTEVLAETFGIMVYQEDVAKVAMAIAGFSSTEADALRKIMSKKDRYFKLNDYREKFFRGAAAKGVEKNSIEKIWQMCLSFTGYSFCKPHSASYVQVSFQSAFLKTHYPAAFMAAVISNYGGYYTTQAYISEAMRLGITIVQPDVNASVDKFIADRIQIHVGLCQIKGLSEKAREVIVREREEGGKYKDIFDLLRRTGIEESDTEKLILAGACDSLGRDGNRPKLFWKMRSFFRTGRNDTTPNLKQFSHTKLLRFEYKALGFLTACHPITLVRRNKNRSIIKIRDIPHHLGRTISFYGWCVTAKTVMTKFGDPMQFVTFEDETGMCETVLFPDAYSKFIRFLMIQEAFAVTGKVMEEFGAVTVEVRKVEPF